MLLHSHIIITGQVQAVGCRYRVKNYADLNKLTGTVKNLNNPDKAEIFIEGLEEQINEFIDWLKTSPGSTKIEKIEILKKEKIDKLSFSDFKIVY